MNFADDEQRGRLKCCKMKKIGTEIKKEKALIVDDEKTRIMSLTSTNQIKIDRIHEVITGNRNSTDREIAKEVRITGSFYEVYGINQDIVLEVLIKQEPLEEIDEDITPELVIKQEMIKTEDGRGIFKTEIKEAELQDEAVSMEDEIDNLKIADETVKEEPQTEMVIKQETIKTEDGRRIFKTKIKEELQDDAVSMEDENENLKNADESVKIKEEPQTTANSKSEKKFICDICNINCKSKFGIKRHILRHTERRENFTCQVCEAVFVSKYNLDRHLRCHTGEKPYECDSCEFKTGDKSNFQRHLKNHLGEKPFACKMCQYKSGERSKLLRHMKIHISKGQFICETCNFKCAYKNALVKHIKQAHPK